jgi:hypothetical protein
MYGSHITLCTFENNFCLGLLKLECALAFLKETTHTREIQLKQYVTDVYHQPPLKRDVHFSQQKIKMK